MIFTVLMALAVLVCVMMAVLIYFSKAPFAIKLSTLPMVILFCISLLIYLVTIAGAPIERVPRGEWEYIHHTTENQGQTIVLWAWVDSFEDYRQYKFPYTRETIKKLNMAQKKRRAGIKNKGVFIPKFENEDQLVLSEGTPRKTTNPLKSYEKENKND